MAETLDLLETARARIEENASVLTRLTDMAGDFAVNLVVAVLILALTWVVASQASRAVNRGLSRLPKADRTLILFLSQLTRWVILIVGLIAILRRLGVETTSIIAVLGAASLAIGLALQGALGNVASGVMLLLLRPYRVGDYVGVGDKAGTVQKLDLFTTELTSPDGLQVVMPNGKVFGDVIVNYGANPTRRVEIAVDVHYDADLDRALKVLHDAVDAHDKVLVDPAPWAGAVAFKDSGVGVLVHAWVASPDFWTVKAELHSAVKRALDQAGIVIPYPHQVQVEAGPASGDTRVEAR